MRRAQILAQHSQSLPKAVSPLLLRAASPQQRYELIAGRPLISTECQNGEQRTPLARRKPDRACSPVIADDVEPTEQPDAETVKRPHLSIVPRQS